LVIHCREAFEQVYKILCSYKNTSLRGIFHSFTGTKDEVEKILFEFTGFMIGITGVITFKNSSLPLVLQHIPLERMVLETDSPYLAPIPHRGKRNESAFLKDILIRIAEIQQVSSEEIAYITSKNTLSIFGIS
jgi:TatD DNase family protein